MLLISIKVLEIFLQKCLVEKFPRELIGPNCNDMSVTCPRRVELCKHSADWHLRENVASIDQSAFLEIFLQGRLCRKISKISHRVEISSINVQKAPKSSKKCQTITNTHFFEDSLYICRNPRYQELLFLP